MKLDAPFPWFGGKSSVASEVWSRFGNCQNYVEPFFGSGAVLLNRPAGHFAADSLRIETVNDLDGYLVNFWRSIKDSPMETAEHACYPVSEMDLHSRHRWLLSEGAARLAALDMARNPDAHDPKVAGWWVWGLCCWIGGGWCVQECNKLPHLGNAGRGVTKKLPHLGDGDPRVMVSGLREWFGDLSLRLARVRIASGDWKRVMGDSVTVKHGVTGVFLDPPYSADRHSVTYAAQTDDVASEVREWCKRNGSNPMYRIALCGYAGEHDLEGWTCYRWKAKGGFGSQGDKRGRENAAQETIWFSPYCEQAGLF